MTTRRRSSRSPATRSRRTSPSRCSCSPRSASSWGWRPTPAPAPRRAHPPGQLDRGAPAVPAGEYSVPTGVGGNVARGATVTPVGGHGSHLLGDLAAANALIVIPESVTRVEAGQPVHVLALDEQF
ncbi:hypothetical protein [Nocardioides zeae]